MSLSIGLDIGGSTTKVMGLLDGKFHGSWLGKADDAEASAYGALFKYLSIHSLAPQDIEQIAVTGVGNNALQDNFIHSPIKRVDEFEAVGRGGLFLTGLKEAVVVSLGTGTAFVYANGAGSRHLIGSGVGGGTLLGLARALFGTRDFDAIDRLAEAGDMRKVDLAIRDIALNDITGLASDVTASNFGKLQNDSEKEDLAAGLVNMIYQTVGIIATLCARNCGVDDVVWVGQASELATGRDVLNSVSKLYGMNFHMPEMAPYATACGAALLGHQND